MEENHFHLIFFKFSYLKLASPGENLNQPKTKQLPLNSQI